MPFEQLPGAIDEGLGGVPLTSDDIAALQSAVEVDGAGSADKSASEDAQKTAALKLVQQDIVICETFQGSKHLPQELDKIDNLYRASVAPKNWPNSNQPRAHLGMPMIMEAVESVISQVHLAFWADKQPFVLEARGKTPEKAARAAANVLKWAIKAAGAKEELRKSLKSTLIYPQGVVKWGWRVHKHEKAQYRKDTNGKITKHPEQADLSIPTLDFMELRNVFVDPGLRNHDIRNADYVIFQSFTDAYGLDHLRDAGYDIPDENELRTILADQRDEATTDSALGSKQETYREEQAQFQDTAASADPLLQPLEILERVDNHRKITVLQRKLVIGIDENEYGRINANSCSFIDVLGSWTGFGIGKLLEGDQRFQTGVANFWIDSLSISLQPTWHRKKGVGASSQNITVAPGRVINDDGDLQQLEVKSNTQDALAAIEASEARATRRVAANAGSEMPSQAMRTAEGVNAFSAGVQIRLQYFIDVWADLVFVPVMEAFLQMCKDNLQPEDINRILSEEDGKEYEGEILDIYNGTYSLDVLSSTKLAAKRAMAQLLPMLMQFFQSEPVQESMAAQKRKVDYVELAEQALDLTGWKTGDLIVDATDEDIQRYISMQPGVMAAQAKSQAEDKAQQNALEQIEAKGVTQAGVHVVKHIVDHSSEQEPAGTGALVNNLEGQGTPQQNDLALQPPAQTPQGPPPAQTGEVR